MPFKETILVEEQGYLCILFGKARPQLSDDAVPLKGILGSTGIDDVPQVLHLFSKNPLKVTGEIDLIE